MTGLKYIFNLQQSISRKILKITFIFIIHMYNKNLSMIASATIVGLAMTCSLLLRLLRKLSVLAMTYNSSWRTVRHCEKISWALRVGMFWSNLKAITRMMKPFGLLRPPSSASQWRAVCCFVRFASSASPQWRTTHHDVPFVIAKKSAELCA